MATPPSSNYSAGFRDILHFHKIIPRNNGISLMFLLKLISEKSHIISYDQLTENHNLYQWLCKSESLCGESLANLKFNQSTQREP